MSIRRFALAAFASAVFAGSAVAKDYELLNVSYDPTRELYQDYNAEFVTFWKNPIRTTRSRSSNPTAARANRRVA